MATGKTAAKKMSKTQLVDELSKSTEKTKKEAAQFLDTLCAIAYRETKKSGEFTLPGIGKLVKAHRKARMVRNPRTGEQKKSPAKTVVKFRIAKAAKDAVLGANK